MSSTLILRPPLSLARRWPLAVCALLLPIWCMGTLYRGAWTPDEPREADIVWHMAHQDDRVLPNFAGEPFLEKPPLSYWVAAGSTAVFGDSVRAARVPNILYTVITALAIGALAFAMAGGEAALLASILASSTLVMLRVSIWLAPDALLMAGCAVALLGAYLGYTAKPGMAKLGAYTLMHAAAAVGFMAKSAPGWIVPTLALLTLIVWERRWSELRRPELYAGLLLQALIIGPWIVSVWREPDGLHALRVLFFDNLAGRFGTVTSADGTAYSAGHQNWPGRYLVELPLSLLPWTFLAVAALRSAWVKFRTGTLNTAWRFALAGSLPFIALLSLASTGRDIYAAPVIPGLGLLMTLWALELEPSLSGLNRFVLKATRVVVIVIAATLGVSALTIAAASGDHVITLVAVPTLIVALAVACVMRARRLEVDGAHASGLITMTAAFVMPTVLASASIFPAVDRWQDLPAVGRAIHRDMQGKSLALLEPDETTLAMMDDSLRTPPVSLPARKPLMIATASKWLCEHPVDGRLLLMLPGHAPGEVSRLLGKLWPEKTSGDGDAATLEQTGVAQLLVHYDVPHGRRYAVMGPATSMPCDHKALAVESP